jgi:SAM-dependent methyltransferase
MAPEAIWRCPRCRGHLRRDSDRLTCIACSTSYESVGEIPDLRVPGLSWIDQTQDRFEARQLLAETRGLDYRDMVAWVYARRSGWNKGRIDLRTRQVLAAPGRLRRELQDWLRPILKNDGDFLEVGCGNGTLLAAAASLGCQGIGVDVSIVWLQVAARMITAYGGRPILAAAMAEALPLAKGAVGAAVSLDVIEHVNDPVPYLTEMDRVTRPGGHLALATPNRFSLSAEPHVFLWGVGLLPRPLQKRYVRWRRGEIYEFTRLLSPFEAARMVRRFTHFRIRIVVPPVPDQEIARFSRQRRILAQLYNYFLTRGLHWLLLPVCPFFRIVGIRRHSGTP